MKLFLVVRYSGIHCFYVMDEVEYQHWEHLPCYRRQKIIFVGCFEEPGETGGYLFWHSTVACLAPQCHTAKTPDQLQILFVVCSHCMMWNCSKYFSDQVEWSRRVFRRGALTRVLHCPPHYLPTEWIRPFFYSQIFINNWQDWQNCILSPWNVVKKLTGQPPACSLDCNGHLTFK